MFCLALLCQAGTLGEVGEILYFSPPLAEDVIPHEEVAKLENCRQ